MKFFLLPTIIQTFNIFIWLSLLIFTSGPATAFSIIPAAAFTGNSFVPSQSYTLENGKSGFVSRQPIGFTSIERGGTEDFLAKLKTEFPESDGWKFLAAPDELKGSFSVSAYYVFYNGTLGGGVIFDYLPGDKDPVQGKDSDLHWIQGIVSNHGKTAEGRTDVKIRNSVHGTAENRIVKWSTNIPNKQNIVPFYDVIPKGAKGPKSVSRARPPHFEYDIGFNDPENDHQWKSEVYLAGINKNDPKTVTIYNGISWGWENRIIQELPQPTGNLLKVQP